jgi:hypothetical protein
MKDDKGKSIELGDILESDWGFKIKVVKDIDGHWYGELICDPSHSCHKLPYALNGGKGYTKVERV